MSHKETASSSDAEASSPRDEELGRIKSILSGETHEFEFFVTAHKNRVFSLFMRSIGNKAVSEELTQEVFVKAYRNLKSFRGDASFSTWLYRIALNSLRSHFRSRAFKQARRNEEFITEVHQPKKENSEESMIVRQRVRFLRLALIEAKEKDREVLLLCGLEGRTYEEVAEILQIPIGTVRSRLSHARARIREAVEKMERRAQ